MMAQPSLDGVDMSKVQFRSYALHFLLAGGKACLLPFLAIYFRMLGLTALQVGLILGIGAWITMISANCWSHCATTCNKRRFVLVTSMLMLIFSYMMLTVVPPISEEEALRFCEETRPQQKNGTSTAVDANKNTTLLTSLATVGLAATTEATPPLEQSTSIPTKTAIPETNNASSIATTKVNTSLLSSTTPVPTAKPTEQPTSSKKTKSTTVAAKTTTKTSEESGVDLSTMFSKDELEALQEAGADMDAMKAMTQGEIASYIQDLINNIGGGENSESARSRDHGRVGRDVSSTNNSAAPLPKISMLDAIWSKIADLQEQLKVLKKQLFAAVMVIMIIAALLASPLDKLMDDTWFEFLDSTDMLEKYGQHKSWGCLGIIMFPVVTSVIIEHTDCLLPGKILNFKIHFFVFLALLLICFFLTFFYPIYRERKRIHRQTQVGRGFRILFGDCHGALYSLSIFLLGAVVAVSTTFLFWFIQDLGGSELIMGICVSVAGLSQLVMHILHKWLIRKLTYPAAMVLGFLVLAARFIAYSFVSSPWIMVAIESFQGLSVGLIWNTVCTYPDFRLNPFVMDRSALSATYILHVGLGISAGSIVSGILYDYIGLAHLFQACCVLCVAWAMIFAILTKCVPKQTKVRYAKLLQDDDSQSEDDSMDENDWLEVALKHQK